MKKELADYLNKETEKLKARQRFERRAKMNNATVLPVGHKWKEVQSATSSETSFQCQCGATFIHDMIDNGQVFEDGDGTCDKE